MTEFSVCSTGESNRIDKHESYDLLVAIHIDKGCTEMGFIVDGIPCASFKAWTSSFL